MLRAARLFVGVVAVLSVGLLLKAGIPQVATGTWQSAGFMTAARAGAASVLLPDGRIMIIGGTDASGAPLATTEFFNPDGTFTPGPSMSVGRSGHAAIWLLNGEVLVTGGVSISGGSANNSAEVFDPLNPQNGWTSLAAMPNARTGHTMTPLSDGSLLLAGGENSSGPVTALDVLEIAPMEHFVPAGTLLTPRTGHAAAALKDGRVLIAGGSDANGVTLASTEIFHPAALSDTTVPFVTAGPVMSTARTRASATTLLDGTVLVAGGSYPEGVSQTNPDGTTSQTGPAELSTAEIFNPATGAFAAVASSMTAARSGQQAFLLPNNNNVLLVGGTYNGQPLTSAELYTPWTGQFQATADVATALTNATGSAMNTAAYPVTGSDGLLLVAGGVNQASAELYGFATVVTDHSDYYPGDTVVITGAGWQAGETVSLTLKRTDGTIKSLSTLTDGSGTFRNSQYITTAQDYLTSSTVTALGSVSHAQTAFTDKTINTDLALTVTPTFIKPGYTPVILLATTLTEQKGGAAVTGETITFTRGQTTIGTATTDSNGVGSYNFDAHTLIESSYTIKANFAGDSTFGQSNNTQTLYVDGTPPETSITANPSNPSNSSSATFSFDAADNYNPATTGNILTLECKLDTAAFSACTGPKVYSDIPDGSHTFQVRAIDLAGNVDPTPASYTWTISTDTTAPTTAATPSGTAGANDWYTSDVQVSLSATDNAGGSGVKAIHYALDGGVDNSAPANPVTVSITTEGAHTLTYYAVDNAGNTETAHSTTVQIDKTSPTITLASRTPANTNGWNNTDVTLTWSCVDSVSGVVSTTVTQTISSEGDNQSATGTCTDKAGNTASDIRSGINIDKTGPTVTASPSPGPNANGWNNSDVKVTFSGADSLSGVDFCTAPVTLSSEGMAQSASGTCTDKAGNVSTTVTAGGINIDKTAPTLTFAAQSPLANAAGWNNANVTIAFTAADSVSGVDTTSVPSPLVFSTEGKGLTQTVMVTDKAGNSATFASPLINLDKTVPTITPSRTPAPNANGWNNSDVTVHFACTDSLSGLSAGSPPWDTTVTTEGSGQQVTGVCTDVAGNSASGKVDNINIDKTAPTATASASPGANTYGWNNADVTVSFSGTDSLSGIDFCTAPVTLSSEGSGQSASGTCTDKAGNASATAKVSGINIDKTAPANVTVSARGTDSNGWYNHAFTATWSGTDSLSGIASCISSTYSGPDTKSGALSGTCTDKAGNVSAAVAFAFRYDSTPPTLSCNAASFTLAQPGQVVTATVTDVTSGANPATVSAAADTSTVGSHTISLTGYDFAGNSATGNCGYGVNYKLIAFLQPWGPPGSVAFKHGSTIPLKWQYANYAGVPVDSYNSNLALNPMVGVVGMCSATPTAVLEGIDDAGSSGLQYDFVTFTWQYNWQTKAVNGTCFWMGVQSGLTRQLDVTAVPPGATTPKNLWVQLR